MLDFIKNAFQKNTTTPESIKAKKGSVVDIFSMHDFAEKVLKESFERVVIADFWAPWCGPCRQLVPLLERVVEEFSPYVLLAKINIDENPELAQQMRIQSVPTVYIFIDGKPVDGFMGIMSSPQLVTLIQKYINLKGKPDEENVLLPQLVENAFTLLFEERYNEARYAFTRALDQDAGHFRAMVGYAHSSLFLNQKEIATSIISALSEKDEQDETFISLMHHVSFLEYIKLHKNEWPPLIQEALSLFEESKIEEAITSLINAIKNKVGSMDENRNLLLRIFNSLGYNHKAAIKGRKSLTSVLFL